MSEIKVIQTEYDGHRFRSRTEARWAVFFKFAGIRYEYEKEGFEAHGRHYLPDFWLPDLEMWFEVKGEEPSDEDAEFFKKFAIDTQPLLLGIGAPNMGDQIMWFRHVWQSYDDMTERYHFADDRRDEGVLWLASRTGMSSPIYGSWTDHERAPSIWSATRVGYVNAREARFEHGEKPK